MPPQTDQDFSVPPKELKANNRGSYKYRWDYPEGDAPEIAFSGSNVGGQPEILIAEYWMDDTVGSRKTVGNWTTGLYGAVGVDDYPQIYQLGTTRGIGTRNNPGDNRLTGFRKNFPLARTIFCAWQMGIPDGYYFAGASAEETLPPGSNLKMIWLSDEPLGSDLNDLVCCSRNNPATWFVGGNHSGADHYVGGEVNWDVPMGFSLLRKPGANSYTDNGTSIATQTMLSGWHSYTKNDEPLLSKRSKLRFTVQNNATYTCTIDGIDYTVISDASATEAELTAAMATAINDGAFNGGATYTSTQIEIIPATGTVPVISVTSNITLTHGLDGYRYLSTYWQGNGNQAGTMHVFPYIYAAVGDNAGNYIMLANSGTLDATCTKTMVIPFDTWNAGISATANPTASQLAGMTHAHLFKDGIAVASMAIA